MLKQLKPGHYYIIINLDEPYAEDVYEVLKYGQMQKGEDAWPEGDIDYLQWVRHTWCTASDRDFEGAFLAAKMGQVSELEREQSSLITTLRNKLNRAETVIEIIGAQVAPCDPMDGDYDECSSLCCGCPNENICRVLAAYKKRNE